MIEWMNEIKDPFFYLLPIYLSVDINGQNAWLRMFVAFTHFSCFLNYFKKQGGLFS